MVRTHQTDMTILLVEDEPTVRRYIERILTDDGHCVVSVSSPCDALKLASEHPGTIHVLVSDVTALDPTRPGLADRLKELHPGIACLFISGYPADMLVQRGLLETTAQFIQKPFGPHELREALGQLA